MCGRSRCALAPEQVAHAAGTHALWVGGEQYEPAHNITPGHDTPIVYCPSNDGPPMIRMMRWGLVPYFAKKDVAPDHWKMFNARSESVAERPAFRHLVASRRCLVPLSGFYEWKKEDSGVDGKKQPNYIYLKGDQPMIMAGLYDTWLDANGQRLYTYTILTTDSGKKLAWLHDRMPVILRDEESRRLWLDPSSTHKMQSVLGPYDGDDLTWHKVTKKMSNPAFQGPECAMLVVKPPPHSFFQPHAKSEAPQPSKLFMESIKAIGNQEIKQEASPEEAKAVDNAGPTVNADEKPTGTPEVSNKEKPNESTKAPGSYKRKANGDRTGTPPSKTKAMPKLPGQRDIGAFLIQKKKGPNSSRPKKLIN